MCGNVWVYSNYRNLRPHAGLALRLSQTSLTRAFKRFIFVLNTDCTQHMHTHTHWEPHTHSCCCGFSHIGKTICCHANWLLRQYNITAVFLLSRWEEKLTLMVHYWFCKVRVKIEAFVCSGYESTVWACWSGCVPVKKWRLCKSGVCVALLLMCMCVN